MCTNWGFLGNIQEGARSRRNVGASEVQQKLWAQRAREAQRPRTRCSHWGRKASATPAGWLARALRALVERGPRSEKKSLLRTHKVTQELGPGKNFSGSLSISNALSPQLDDADKVKMQSLTSRLKNSQSLKNHDTHKFPKYCKRRHDKQMLKA